MDPGIWGSGGSGLENVGCTASKFVVFGVNRVAAKRVSAECLVVASFRHHASGNQRRGIVSNVSLPSSQEENPSCLISCHWNASRIS
jgi:hypothetical protein